MFFLWFFCKEHYGYNRVDREEGREPSIGNRAENDGPAKHVQVAPRSTHTLTVRSLSIDPEAIMFCCGWVCDEMELSTVVETTKLYDRLPRPPQRRLQGRGPISKIVIRQVKESPNRCDHQEPA
jgi:hypothetical protein